MPGIKTAKSSQDKNRTQTPNPANTDKGNLDQIRDILFGDQVRQYDNQFLQLKSHFTEEMKQMRREMGEQFAEYKTMLERINKDMTERFNVEKQQRAESQSELSGNLKESSKTLLSRMAQGEQDIRILMEAQLSQLRKDMDQLHQDAVTSTERMIAELKTKKANSEDLAALFADISSSLSGTQKETPPSNHDDKKS